jgi:hypothetical protein
VGKNEGSAQDMSRSSKMHDYERRQLLDALERFPCPARALPVGMAFDPNSPSAICERIALMQIEQEIMGRKYQERKPGEVSSPVTNRPARQS